MMRTFWSHRLGVLPIALVAVLHAVELRAEPPAQAQTHSAMSAARQCLEFERLMIFPWNSAGRVAQV